MKYDLLLLDLHLVTLVILDFATVKHPKVKVNIDVKWHFIYLYKKYTESNLSLNIS